MKHLLFFVCLFSGTMVFAQQQATGIDPGIVPGNAPVAAPKQPSVYMFVEQMPAPPYDMNEYLGKSLRYPKQAKKDGIGGRVAVEFVVNADSTISDVKVARGIGGGCDEEAVRVIKNMPKWKPGKQSGKTVNVRFMQPITFRLE